ncbi:MAG: arginyl-tRNA synthetase [Thermoleophilia bacterium]|nr:arginyl-tRNA synthetase [Thermoleophilia bacterium]
MASTTQNSALRGLHEALQAIVDELARAGDAAGTPRVELERPRDEAHGDFATNAALMLAPVVRRNPREVAQEIAERAGALPGVTSVDVAGPGFINLTMGDDWFLETVEAALDAGDRFGADVVANAAPILLEFVSANPTGPLVAASARHAAYGDALARILRHAGHDVTTEFYVNDAGRQVDLFGASILARATGSDVPEDGYQGDYVTELAAELGVAAGDDPVELGQRGVAAMIAGMRTSLEQLGIRFDTFFSEKSLHESGAVDRGIEHVAAAGYTDDEDGAVILRTTTWGDDRDRAIRRANGVPTYFAADIAYLEDKFSRVGAGGHLIYVLGADHHGYIARLKGASQALGHEVDTPEIVIMQMVTLSESGEQKKMSKRRGDFVTAAELVDRIGADATRFWMLERSHDQQLEIDLDAASAQGDENPVYYVQMMHARLCSIRRNVEAAGLADGDASAANEPLHASEKRVIKRLSELPIVVADAAERRVPHRVHHYARELATDVSKFYRDCRVMGDGIDPAITARRLRTADAARSVLALALSLVGVSAPEAMERREVEGGEADA